MMVFRTSGLGMNGINRSDLAAVRFFGWPQIQLLDGLLSAVTDPQLMNATVFSIGSGRQYIRDLCHFLPLPKLKHDLRHGIRERELDDAVLCAM